MRSARMVSAMVITGLALASVAFGQAGDPFGKPGTPPPPSSTSPPSPQRETPKSPAETKGDLVDLRPKFKKGQELRYVMEMSGKNSITSKANKELDQKQTTMQRIGLVMRIKEVGDEGAVIEVVYDSIRVVMDTPDGKAEFDSTKAKKKPDATKPKPGQPAPAGNALDDLLAQIIGPMVGTRLEVKTDKNGAITSVSGGEALSGGAIEGLLGGAAGGGGAPGGVVPSGKSAANWLTGGVPGTDGRVRVGQTWTNTDDLGSTPAGAFKMVTTHTLKSHSGGLAMVMFNGRADGSSSEGGGGGPMGGLIKLKGAGYRGQYQWDTGAGCLREMNSEMTTEMIGKIGEDEVVMTGSTTTRVKKQ